MVPTHFVYLDAFPTNPNGKTDRHRLPAPVPTREGLDGEFFAPADELERSLAVIWQELLHVACIGTRDDFFELGGHSLIASRLRARVMETLGVDLPLGDFFEHRTIEAQARRIVAAWPCEG